jgi:hypothetical protein
VKQAVKQIAVIRETLQPMTEGGVNGCRPALANLADYSDVPSSADRLLRRSASQPWVNG